MESNGYFVGCLVLQAAPMAFAIMMEVVIARTLFVSHGSVSIWTFFFFTAAPRGSYYEWKYGSDQSSLLWSLHFLVISFRAMAEKQKRERTRKPKFRTFGLLYSKRKRERNEASEIFAGTAAVNSGQRQEESSCYELLLPSFIRLRRHSLSRSRRLPEQSLSFVWSPSWSRSQQQWDQQRLVRKGRTIFVLSITPSFAKTAAEVSPALSK